MTSEFSAAIRADHFELASDLQDNALGLLLEFPEFEWDAYFEGLYEYYPPQGLFGYHGRVVASLRLTQEKLSLIEHAQQFIPFDSNEVTVANVEDFKERFDVVRNIVARANSITWQDLREALVADGQRVTRERRPDWRLDWLERNQELVKSGSMLRWVPLGERNHKRSVPIFNEYFARYSDMNAEQREYYEADFKPRFLNGEAVDVEKNWSYVFVLLKRMIGQLDKYEVELPAALRLAADMGGDTSLGHYARDWLADLYFLAGNFDEGFEVQASMLPDDLIARTIMVPDRRVTAIEIASFAWSGHGLTKFGLERFEEVKEKLQAALDDFHANKGHSLLADLWFRLVDHVENKQPLHWEEDEGLPFLSENEALELLQECEVIWKNGPPETFQGAFPGSGSKRYVVDWPTRFPDTDRAFGAVRNLLARRLMAEFRKAENLLREHIGVPRIGEGWVSEISLYRQIKATFHDFDVRHQGRPAWLGRQSLDIFFPDFNIGIEYQGAQHFRSVEYFGGDDAFAAQKERDKRKRGLCKENGCVLIEVFPDYDYATVVAEISKALTVKKAHR